MIKNNYFISKNIQTSFNFFIIIRLKFSFAKRSGANAKKDFTTNLIPEVICSVIKY